MAVTGGQAGCYGGATLCASFTLTLPFTAHCATLGSYAGYYLGAYLGDSNTLAEAVLYLYDVIVEIFNKEAANNVEILNVNPKSVLDILIHTKDFSANKILLALPFV